MYANGHYIRPATLADVEDGSSWDLKTVRALMGGGCLYVSKVIPSADNDSKEWSRETKDVDYVYESDDETKDSEVLPAKVCAHMSNDAILTHGSPIGRTHGTSTRYIPMATVMYNIVPWCICGIPIVIYSILPEYI